MPFENSTQERYHSVHLIERRKPKPETILVQNLQTNKYKG